MDVVKYIGMLAVLMLLLGLATATGAELFFWLAVVGGIGASLWAIKQSGL